MARNVQVLLVGRDKEFLVDLRRYLNHGTEVIAEASLGIEAVRLAQQSHPGAIIVHVEEPAIRAVHTMESIAAVAPESAIIAISSIDSGVAVRRAMRSGAIDYVPLPLKGNELDQAVSNAHDRVLRRLAALHGEPVDTVAGTILTVFGPKGGIGKTTLSTNLALSLRVKSGAQVCIVDMDAFFGDVAVALDIRPQVTVTDYLRQVHAGQNVRVEEFLYEHTTGLTVLPSPGSIGASPIPTPDETVQILTRLAQLYDYVVVDTPGAYSSSVVAALDTSTLVLLVTSPDLASVKDVRLALDLLRSWEFSEDRIKLTVNNPTRNNAVSKKDLEQALGYEVFWSIPFDREIAISNQTGVPSVLRIPTAKASRSIIGLATALAGTAVMANDTGSASLFGGLLRRLTGRQEVRVGG
jgi:pilus assembly protein CpaE